MRNVLCTIYSAGAVALAATSLTAQTIRVVATTPDLAAIVKAVGGAAVEVQMLAKATEDPHYVDARPSHVVTLNRADVLVFGGADLETGWLAPLLQSARNPKIAPGAAGRISAAEGISLLERPLALDRTGGDVHALGNPHFLLDPRNAGIVAARIGESLAQLAPASAVAIRGRAQAFAATLTTKQAEWRAMLAPFAGAPIVTYHRDFVYLAATFNLQVVETLEPKPGIAPSPAHLAQVIATMKSRNARVIMVQPFQNRRTAETVARQTGAVVLDLPHQPGAVSGTDGYFELMDYMVRTLAGAFGGGSGDG
jgi:ABC-type Zn uptake system ZnuABC Zn-binding protein ZnuA